MQALVRHAGGHVEAIEPAHGVVARIRHGDDPLFADIPQDFSAVRYHSLAAVTLPETVRPIAWSEDGVVMGVRHRTRPLVGVQFHPESILTEHGAQVVANFLEMT